MEQSYALTWHFLHQNHQQPLMDVVFGGDFQSEIAPKQEDMSKRYNCENRRKEKILTEVTFVKLMPLSANTAKALNSTPGPSSRVKTTLVQEQSLYIIQYINEKHVQM